MRVACVALADRSRLWVDCAAHDINTLDRVRVSRNAEEFEATVVVSPQQLVAGAPAPTGVVLQVGSRTVAANDESLPGAQLPILGSHYESSEVGGIVTGIDPLTQTVTVTPSSGASITVTLGSDTTLTRGSA